ncbi:hypothetical protein [Spongiactinospora sp. 9N601]|uniref:hypothetical protein n=1 Tax=Spongiactinospora sp. 9N601 TaxID=3375149 RepID=UPI0037B0E055
MTYSAAAPANWAETSAATPAPSLPHPTSAPGSSKPWKPPGFEPRAIGDTIALVNCPFHSLALRHTELVCGMNLGLLTGLLEGLAATDVTARLEPAPEHCCVRLHLS